MTQVLLVEDEAAIRHLLTEFLEALGHEVATATDGAQALAAVRQERPAVVVLDLMLPEVDGWTFLRTCRQTPELAALPVVVISARQEACESVTAFGVLACLSKPFDLDQLAALLDGVAVSQAPCSVPPA